MKNCRLARRVVVTALFALGCVVATPAAHACSTSAHGVYVNDYVEQVTEIPSDGVLGFQALLNEIEPEEAMNLVKVRVLESDGTPVAGTLDWRLLGKDPDKRPLEPRSHAMGRGYSIVGVWTPTEEFEEGTHYEALIDVAQPVDSLEVAFEAVDPLERGALGEAAVRDLRLSATERTGGTRKCCEVVPDTCNNPTSCWDEDWVYFPTVSGRLDRVTGPHGQVLYRLWRADAEVAEATWFAYKRTDGPFDVEFKSFESDSYCVAVEAIDLATGDAYLGPQKCVSASEMEAFERQSDTIPAPSECVSEPFVDEDGDRQPDDGTGAGDGADDGRDDTNGDASSSMSSGAGCGCDTASQPRQTSIVFVVFVCLSALLVRRFAHLRQAH